MKRSEVVNEISWIIFNDSGLNFPESEKMAKEILNKIEDMGMVPTPDLEIDESLFIWEGL